MFITQIYVAAFIVLSGQNLLSEYVREEFVGCCSIEQFVGEISLALRLVVSTASS